MAAIAPPSQHESPEAKAASTCTPRPMRLVCIIGLALILIVLNCGWIANSEIRNNLTEGTVSTLFLGVVFILFLLTLANLLVRRVLGPGVALNQAELMLVYTMLSMSSAIAGVSHIGFLTVFLASPFWHSQANPATSGFQHLLPFFIGPRDPAVLRGFYKGGTTFFQPRTMAAWAWPLLVWGVFLMILLWTQLCLCSILRRRWAEEEHLSFPVIALPLEITREGAPIYRNKLFQAGFAVPLFFHSLNTLAGLYPSVPSFRINSARDLSYSLSTPWTGVDAMLIMLHPVGVGFGYLVNTDALFSLWFFYLLKKGVDVFGVVMGLRTPRPGDWGADSASQFPFTSFQSWGAWAALIVAVLWTSRSYLSAYIGRAMRGDPKGIDKGEAMSARWAIGGLLVGFFALCGFIWSLGGSIWLPIVFFGGYLVIMLGIARVRAEMAVLATSMDMLLPQFLTSLLGTANLSEADIVHISTFSWFNIDYRSTAMAQEMEGLQGQRRSGGKLSVGMWAILIASAFAIVSAVLWDLQMYYVNGAESSQVVNWRNIAAAQPWQTANNLLRVPTPANTDGFIAAVFGFAMVLILAALRARFIGFPFHPAAYAINAAGMNDYFWFDMLVAWIVKTLFLRYGGKNLYQTAMPFFLGMILGDFATGAAWCLYGTLAHLVLFRTFPV